MKILQINKFYFEQGGTEHYLFAFCRLLEEKGHQVIPFAMQHKENLESRYSEYFPSFVDTLKLGISSKKVKAVGRMFYSYEAQRKIESLIKKEKPDIAHIHNIYHQISPSILPVLKKQSIPIVMTVHDYKLICPNYILYTQGAPCKRCKGGKYFQGFYHRCLKDSYLASFLVALEMHFHKLLKIYQKNIDLYLVPSEFVKERLVEFGMDKNKIVILPHPVKIQNENLKINQGKYLLCVSRLKKEKGVDVLIKAMKFLPDVALIIAGSGPEEANLKSQAQSIQNIKFLGQVGQSEIFNLYQDALAVIIPSRVWETFALSAAEALTLGKPVVAANLGALPELIQANETGLLFEPENPEDLAQKIKFILNNPEQAQEMAQKGQKEIKAKLDPQKHYQEIIKIYESLQTAKVK